MCADATVRLAVRCAPGLPLTTTRTDALPDPDAGLTVAQVASLAAVHPQALSVCTVTLASQAAAASGACGPDTSNRHGAGSCARSAC